MIYIANYGTSLSQSAIDAINSFVLLSNTPAGEHLAKVAGAFANTPDTGGGGTPGGSDTQLQWNNAGAFGGIVRATTDGTTVSFLANGILVKDQTDATKIAAFDSSAITTGTTRTFAFPDLSGTIVLTTGAQSLASKTIGITNIVTLRDDRFTLQDDADNTKQAVFQLSGITTATTRTYTLPDASDTVVVLAATQALTGKTYNGLTVSTTTGTFTLTNAKTFVVTHGLTLSGTDSTVMTFPTTSATIARTDAANTFIGASTASAWVLTSPTITTKLNPTTDDGAPLGDTTHNWSDLFLASGAVINYANGDVVITHTAGILTMGTGDLRVTTAGTNTASVVTVGGTQTLAGKTLTAAKIVSGGFLADANGNELIIFTTTASAVNEITIANGATGNAPSITASGETNVDLNIGAKGTGEVKHTTATYQDIVTATDGATITFDVSDGNTQNVVMAGNRTLAISNAKVGQWFVLRLVQDGTGTRVPTWFTTIKWAGGVAPTLTTTINKADTFLFLVTSSGNYDGYIVGQNV